jgi:hypothetical protein
LIIDYFNNFDNEFLNKYKINFKNIFFINVFLYLRIDSHLNFIQFHYRLIVYQRLSNFHVIFNNFNLMVFDGLSNDNKII